MEWTQQIPDKPGYYWLRHRVKYTVDDPVVETEIVLLERGEGNEWYVSFSGSDWDSDLETLEGFWYGPIEQPLFLLTSL